ncbi:hypothetical protein [Flagellimonas allohymeniacidonis]|uniref:Uncharacterized protein n=1 Tax=Flagellimonas allohymeniacidonis TaxID=2517819 RepID=A0A4Q8QEZ6_9FLAO|nr:hypothetical protein [Allomuricauda hymeniacidonis]TAI49031.1 hypothetical protein EW142_04335 [Allomuricauda hymeniacidonis]
MIFQKTNIERKLQHLKNYSKEEEEKILAQVQHILNREKRRTEKISETLGSKKHTPGNDFVFDLLETEKIYHIDQIKKICIDYRLRFLDSRYFKGKIPATAFEKITQLENQHHIEIEGFKIMAPSKLFKLEDKDDPLLFAPIGNDYFYLIHKWGNDLHPLRKLLVWPFKSIVNLTVFTLLISYLVTLMVPSGLFSKNDSSAEFWIIYFFMFKCIASVVIFYGFALGKNFNPAIWNSKYFNA